MHLAYQAWDLQTFSKGRFQLGIGSQVKAHIEKRFGVEFSHPASRMREYIQALKAIFGCWQDGDRLDFQGEYYRHTLMTPMFNPGPNAFGPPPILLGALGPLMTEVAGEVADGLIVHPFSNLPFLTGAALPAVERGLAKSGRRREDFTLQVNAIVITGETPGERAAATESVRGLLGFYASTPAYRPPMEAVGCGELQPELNRLSKEGRWQELGAHIDEAFLDAFTTRGEPGEIAGKLREKYGPHADRLAIYAPYAAPDSMWKRIIAGLKDAD
jgi:probable F420-dependent oxidoreductase